MPVVTDPQTGVTFFDEGETDADGNVSSDHDPVVSATPEPEPARVAPKVERPRFDNPNARRAAAPAKVEIIPDEPAAITATDDEDEDPDGTYERELDEFIAAQVAARVAAEAAKVQSAKDKEIARAEKKAQALEERMARLEEELEAAKLDGLDDDERASFKDAQALEKKRKLLDAQAEELAEIYKARQIELLIQTYGYAGVAEEDLEDIDDPDLAEKFCKQAEKFFLAGGGKKPGDEVTTPKATAPVSRPRPAKPVPAAASAPSDVGGDPIPLGKARKFNEEQTPEAMAENIANSPWVNIRL